MSYLDTYYRALLDYRRITVQDRDCGSQRSATVKANARNDSVIVKRKICHVNTDWIERIEMGLEHVDKAIREERQFIRSNGEVVDIEKVKSVSKDSVKHLAQHSNLITRYEEGQDIIPDSLYIVERLNDYAVYENRFLYMMLCYLRDFITIRYNKILELEHTYNGAMTMSKRIEMPKRQLSFDISLKETRGDDPFLKERSGSKNVIARIRDILEYVHAFLNTPLMQEVSKVPMIKPPVTKTNVLRMNNNFRGALALYEYVAAYEGDGYTVTEETQKIQPFRIDMADEFSEIVLLSSFLTYQHGMNVKSALHEIYEKEEERRRRAQEKKHLEQIKALRRRITESGESPEEYMLMLERRNRALEADSEKLDAALQRIDELEESNTLLKEENEKQTEKLASLYETIETIEERHKAEIEELTNVYEKKVAGVCAYYEQALRDLREEHENEIESLQDAFDEEKEQWQEQMQELEDSLRATIREAEEQHAAELEQLVESHALALQETTDNYEARLTELREELQGQIEELAALRVSEGEAMKSAWQAEVLQLQTACKEKDATIEARNRENEQLESARRLAEARMLAMRKEHGMLSPDQDFTSRESFEELERQFETFKALFNDEWKKTKKHIRKTTLRSYKDAIKEGRDKEFLEDLSKSTEEQNVAVAPVSTQETATEQPAPQQGDPIQVEESAAQELLREEQTSEEPTPKMSAEEALTQSDTAQELAVSDGEQMDEASVKMDEDSIQMDGNTAFEETEEDREES